MKLNLGIDISLMSGYTTIDPAGGQDKVCLDIRNIDSVVDNGECEEINASRILDHIHGSQLYSVIQHWVSKLAHGGKIILGGKDILEVSKLVVTGSIGNSDSNKVFYGVNNSSLGLQRGMYECNEIVSILSELGLHIDKKRINGLDFIVEAHRV